VKRATLIAVLLTLAVASAAWASTWRTVAAKSVTGGYATATVSATISTPHGIRVRTNNTISGYVGWSMVCVKGTSSVSKRGEYSPPAGIVTHRLTLPFSGHPAKCIVAATGQIHGTGTLRIALQKLVL
jgi:hypothetical protein